MLRRCSDVVLGSVELALLDHNRPNNNAQQHQHKNAEPDESTVAGREGGHEMKNSRIEPGLSRALSWGERGLLQYRLAS